MSSASDSDDDDFLPVIPPPQPVPETDAVIEEAVPIDTTDASERKRPRTETSPDEGADENRRETPEELMWQRYSAQQLPRAALYERSFSHNSAHSTEPTQSNRIMDIVALEDDHGALTCSIDSTGVVRVWRKLPRGLFFLGELEAFRREQDDAQERSFYLRADSLMRWLIVFEVEEKTSGTSSEHVDVAVRMQLVNTSTLTIESRSEFEFKSHVGQYTASPFVVMHQYQPHVAFFVKMPAGAGVSSSALVNQSGVVLVPCFPVDRSAGKRVARVYHPLPIAGTTGTIVQCVQQPLGKTAEGTSPVGLIDEQGIINYATIATQRSDEPDAPACAALEVIRGLAACAPRSMQARLWHQWVKYRDIRSTDFFAIRRDAVALGKKYNPDNSNNASAPASRAIPLSAVFTPTGRHLVVFTMTMIATPTGSGGSACVRAEESLYIFDFPTGKCVGRFSQLAGTGQVIQGGGAGVNVLQSPHVNSLAQHALVGITVVESAALMSSSSGMTVPGFYVHVPEVVSSTLHELLLETDSFNRGESVQGRAVRVLEVLLPPGQQAEVTLLPRAVGALEVHVREAAAQNTERSSHQVSTGHHYILRVPLILLRKHIEPSQSLKNLIARSTVGSRLSQEEMKKLFYVPSRTERAVDASGESTMAAGADPVLATTSMRPTAMIVYGAAENLMLATALTRAMESSAVPASAEEGSEITLSHQLEELRLNRDFNCADLLRPSFEPAAAVEGASSSPDASAAPAEAGLSSATAAAVAVSSPADEATNGKDNEEATVWRLLSAAAPSLAPEATASAKRGIVFVKGFGAIELVLMPSVAPLAVDNFVRLGQRGYYNGLTFHRVIPSAIVQGGCPRGDGTGGESAFEGGASFPDENTHVFPFFSHTEKHVWLCMANAGKDTNGSQFFFTVPGASPMEWLNGHHTVFGFVTGGKDVITRISQVSRDAEDKPRTPIVMERVSSY